MVQEIKITDDFKIQFKDISGAEYFEITNSINSINAKDFKTDKEYQLALKLNNINFIDNIAKSIFTINDEKIETIHPYQMPILHDLVAGYLSDTKAKKAWDLRGWGIKQKEKEVSEKNSKVSKKSKEKSK